MSDVVGLPSKADSAFTLVEVMVAIAILGVSLAPLLVTHGSFLKSFALSKERTYEVLGSVSALALVEAIGLPEAEGTYSGEVEGAPRLRWEAGVGAGEEMTLVTVEAVTAPVASLEQWDSSKGGVKLSCMIVDLTIPPPDAKEK